MRRLILFLLFVVSISSLNAQNDILELSVSPSSSSAISIDLKSSCNFAMVYNGFSYTVENQIITVSVCYRWGFSDVYTELQNNITIPEINVGAQNYTLIVHIYAGFLQSCTYDTILDAESLSFSTPLTQTVFLATENLTNKSNKLTLFPNPSSGRVNYQMALNSLPVKVEIFDHSGRKIQTVESLNDQYFTLDELADGIYTVKLHNGSRIFTQQIILRK